MFALEDRQASENNLRFWLMERNDGDGSELDPNGIPNSQMVLPFPPVPNGKLDWNY